MTVKFDGQEAKFARLHGARLWNPPGHRHGPSALMIPHLRTLGVAPGSVPARRSVWHGIFKRDIGLLLRVHMKCSDRKQRLALAAVNPWRRRAAGQLRNVGGDAAILVRVSVRKADARGA